MSVDLRLGDCRQRMAEMPDNSVDAVVCDPPYHLTSIVDRFGKEGAAPSKVPEGGSGVYARASRGFMGQTWDGGDVAFQVETWREVWRVLKPGGHLLAFSGSRTYHRMTCAIEDAGFEIRDQIMWVYGSGFPKSLDVSKAIDKHGGVPQNVIRIKNILREAHRTSGRTLQELNEVCGFEASGYLRGSSTWTFVLPSQEKWVVLRDALSLPNTLDVSFAKAEREVFAQKKWSNSAAHFVPGADHTRRVQLNVTAPATDAARQWSGWGTALKPAHEPICLARKPLQGTVAANVMRHGTGAINVDGCRVEGGKRSPGYQDHGSQGPTASRSIYGDHDGKRRNCDETEGRWPANFIHDGSDEATAGLGEAARFFYCAKASRSDREEGCDELPLRTGAEAVEREEGSVGMDSPRAGAGRTALDGVRCSHPTVKPTNLMRYLVRMVTPPGGTVLDPFMGSGSTGKAATLEGFNFIGIEMNEDYLAIAQARINAAIPPIMRGTP